MSKTTALAGFKDALGQNLAAVQKSWDAAVAGDEDAVHDLRIALRRSRAVMHIAKRVIAEDVRSALLTELKWLATSTSDARDLDVAASGWEDVVGLEPVLDQIRARQRSAHAAMRAALESERARVLLADWDSLTHANDASGVDASRNLRSIVKHRLRRAHRRVMKDEAAGMQRHQLRKDVKRVRYIVDSFEEVFRPKARKKFVSGLQRFQNELGRAQDITVQLALLESVLAESDFDAPTLSVVNQLTTRLHDEQVKALEGGGRLPKYGTKKRRRQLKRLVPR